MGVKQTQQTDKQKTKQDKMPETRVPMTLRYHFLQDPFFKSAWEDMDTFRGSFFKDSQSQSAKMIETSEKKEETQDSGFKNKFGRYLVPRKWMMPSLWSGEESLKLSDSSLINLVDDETKLEISLNTAGYQPSELSVNVGEGELVIEGQHQERSQAGEMMVSRQFRRQYGLPHHTKLAQVVSNLSQDGVLVVTVPKEKRITDLKEENKIKMERKKSVEKKEESKSVDQIKVEQRSAASTESSENKARTTSVVPLNLRKSFFDDPFFNDSWLDIQQSQRDFFSKAEERFSQQRKMLESTRDNFGFSSLANINKDFDLDLPKMSLLDADELKVLEAGDKVELSLDTAGYKPDELKVTAGRGVVCVEGKHEEKTQSGEVMVSRQMSRQYQLPSSADPAQVTSNLSRDGVLLITIPKIQQQINQDRNVPITMN